MSASARSSPRPVTGPPWPRVDAVLAGALTALSVGYVLAAPAGAPYRPASAATLLLAAAGPLVLLWRQTAPLAAQAGAVAALMATAAVGSPIGFLAWPAWFTLFTCFAQGGRRLRAAATAIAVLGSAGYLFLDRGDPLGDLPSIVMSSLVAAVTGELSSRRARAAAADARRTADSEEQAMAAERLLLQERGRLARELHDSLGHTVNVMVLQAGVGRRVFIDNPAYAHEALASIENAGRGALDELNRMLRLLEPDERTEPFTPTPTDLAELVERVRATGRPVTLRTGGIELPAATARAVYRITQEALTNAVRHTSGGTIGVTLSQLGDDVQLEVVNECNDPPRVVPGHGHGLVNMRERARLEGGDLEVGRVDGAFRVRAVLPAAVAT